MVLITVPVLLGLSAAFVVLRGIYHVIYNLYLHPLASFPGPKIAGITRLYYFKYLLGGTLPRKTLEWHEEYGGIVRIAPDELSVNTAEGWRDIYGTRIGKPEMPKEPIFYSVNPGSIISSTRERHGPLRRIISHGFSEKALRDQEPEVQKYCDLLLKRLHERCENGAKAINMVQWFNFFTFDIIGDLCFGESFGCLDGGSYHPWVAVIFASIKANVWMRFISDYPFLRNLLNLFTPGDLKKKRAMHMALAKEKVMNRINQKSDRADFLSGFLMEDADASRDEMIATSRSLILAGSETTATLLSGVTYHLLRNPSILKKVVDEVRTTFSAESEITFIGVNQLRYMLACLDEGLRIYPPVPGSMPRTVPPGGDKIGDAYVPEGTIVAVAQWATYHDKANFYLPDEYVPERWLGDERFNNDNKAALQPFSTGPRNCVGKNLAYVEMRVALARLLWNFDLVALDPRSEHWATQHAYILWDKPELLVRLKPIREGQSWLQ